MTLQEFKAWFDGFTENISEQPTLKQWARIKERVGEINGVEITAPIYVDHWWGPYRPYYPTYWSSTGGSALASSYIGSNALTSNTAFLSAFNSTDAMHAAGQAEAASMN